MKKTILLFILFPVIGFSQLLKNEKISFSEYEDLKYISTKENAGFNFFENINRVYDTKGNLMYSQLIYKKDYVNVTYTIYKNGDINYTYTANAGSQTFTINGNLTKYGVNKLLSRVECGAGQCEYSVFMNNKNIYTGNSEYVIEAPEAK